MKCWASSLGDCAGGMSGEHYISATLWDGAFVTIQGFKWCKTEPREIPVPRLKTKILCKAHNGRLSPVDAAAGVAFRAMRSAQGLANARAKVPQLSWLVRWYGIDGVMLERWFLKTAINIFTMEHDEAEWELPHSPTGPPEQLVRWAFGLEPIVKPFGLYAVGKVGKDLYSDDSVKLAPLWTPSKKIAGASFVFRGFEFILNLLPAVPPFVAGENLFLKASELIYHLNRVYSDVGGRRSHLIDFRWPDRAFDYFDA